MLTSVAVFPVTVQVEGVVEAKLTANPELAVAARVTGPPSAALLSGPNAMVCGAPCNTEKDWVRDDAAA